MAQADLLGDGRVLIDRDQRWPELKAAEVEVTSAARAAQEELKRAAAEAIRELTAKTDFPRAPEAE